MTKQEVLAKAYGVVPTCDYVIDAEVKVVRPSQVNLSNKAYRTVNPGYAHIPEARELSWEDDFFDDDDDIVAVFDLDYDLKEEYYRKLNLSSLGVVLGGWSLPFALINPQLSWLALLAVIPCYLDQRNLSWDIRALHVAITRDGIRFVRDKRPQCCGHPCTDAAKFIKTVPFDKITDCVIVEPAGTTYCWIPNTLYTIHVDTANRGKAVHELSISGLKNPAAFKKLIWGMKRAYQPAVARLPSALEMADCGDENVAEILRDIRYELRKNNASLQEMKQQAVPSVPSEMV